MQVLPVREVKHPYFHSLTLSLLQIHPDSVLYRIFEITFRRVQAPNLQGDDVRGCVPSSPRN